MPRPVTLFTGQWADLPFEAICAKAKELGYEAVELACWGDHFDVQRCVSEDGYAKSRWDVLEHHGLGCYAISNHLAGQAVCDLIDERHESILPAHVWGDGDAEGVRQRAAQEMIATGEAAKRLFDAAPDHVRAPLEASGRYVVNGFTGSSIWHLLYSFPPVTPEMIDSGFADFAERWLPILNRYEELGVYFALEVHPTEIAFDIVSADRAVESVQGHPHFGFNYDPSHFGYQNVDYLGFLRYFGDRIFNVHVKDVWWSEQPQPIGVFGGHSNFGDDGRAWDFRSPGRGRIDFESLIRLLNHIGYEGPLSVEWEDPAMDREAGAREAADFVRSLDFPRSNIAFDSAFSE